MPAPPYLDRDCSSHLLPGALSGWRFHACTEAPAAAVRRCPSIDRRFPVRERSVPWSLLWCSSKDWTIRAGLVKSHQFSGPGGRFSWARALGTVDRVCSRTHHCTRSAQPLSSSHDSEIPSHAFAASRLRPLGSSETAGAPLWLSAAEPGSSSPYRRRRTYSCVRVSPSRRAAFDLFQSVWRNTCSIV